MGCPSTRLLLIAVGFSVAGLWVAPRAQAAQDETKPVDVGYTALELFDKSQWQAAYDRFAAAERLGHSPVFGLYMARCRAKQGRLREAAELYERVTNESVPASAPAAWAGAIDDAVRELAELKPRIPRVKYIVAPSGTKLASLELDGSPVDFTKAPTSFEVDPGEHRLLATSHDRRTAKTTFQLAERGELEVVLEFAPKRAASVATATANLPPFPLRKGPPRKAVAPRRPDALAIGLWSVGGLSIMGGSIAGIVALQEAADIKQGCVGEHCLASDRDRANRAQSLALASTVLFVVGGVGLAGGTAWFFAAPSRNRDGALNGACAGVGARF